MENAHSPAAMRGWWPWDLSGAGRAVPDVMHSGGSRARMAVTALFLGGQVAYAGRRWNGAVMCGQSRGVRAGSGPGETDPAALPALALGPVLAIAAVFTGVLIALSDRYGYHRDELYFLACGQHLAWGYPDQPPLVPVIARLMTDLAPGSLLVLRLPSALAGGGLVVLTGLLARELGGRAAAQALACAVIALAPVMTGTFHWLETATFNLLAWALLLWLLVRILRTGDQRLWLLAGLIAGAGLLNSDLVAFLMLAVVAALAVAGPRAPLRSGWFYAGGAIALALWAPYLVWQGSHGWPELTVAHSIAAGQSGSSAPWWLIVPEQFILVPAWFAPIWIAGLVRLLRNPELHWCRAAGVAWPVLAVVFMVTGGKPYYLAAYLPVLIAAGAQPTVDWARRGYRRRLGLGQRLWRSRAFSPHLSAPDRPQSGRLSARPPGRAAEKVI